MNRPSVILCLVLLYLSTGVQAQRSERFGPYELFYSVVNTTFLDPEVAARYGITRGKKRAILNLSVREHGTAGSVPRAMLLQGRSWDLMQNQELKFREIREQSAIYYIAEFGFINEEWRFFELDFRPTDAQQTYSYKFRQQLYIH